MRSTVPIVGVSSFHGIIKKPSYLSQTGWFFHLLTTNH